MRLSLWLVLIGYFISQNLALLSLPITEDTGGVCVEGVERAPHPTLTYISIVMGVVFNMLMTLTEQKVSVGQSGIFLQLFSPCFFTFHPLSSLLLLAQSYQSLSFL